MKTFSAMLIAGLISIFFWCAVYYEADTRKNFDYRPVIAKVELLETKLTLERHKNECFEEVIKMHMEHIEEMEWK